MSYSGYSGPKHPRSILVIVGGVIAWLGLVGGVLVTTPEYHRALTMKEEPSEMTWDELVENGLTDNSYIRLIDVELDDSNPFDKFGDMLKDFDPDAAVDEQQEVMEDFAENFAENMNFGELIDTVIQPLKVYPKGKNPDEIPLRIVVPQMQWAIEAAREEIAESGTLTGRFTVRSGEDIAAMFAKAAIAGAIEAQEEAMQQHGIKRKKNEQDVVGDEPVEQQPAEDDQERFVFEPVGAVPSLSEARQWFCLSGFAVAIGLVICGSGGPSIACCVFFQVPSILSIFGYPMRYGRAGSTTRTLYALVGSGLMYYGYKTMIVDAKFGAIDGNIALAVVGYVYMFVGMGALLGATTNWAIKKLNISLEPETTKAAAKPKISITDACSLDPVETSTNYVDPNPVALDDVVLCDELESVAAALAGIGFEPPENTAWQEDETTRPALIQLGCQQMVVADIEVVDEKLQTRLISVLQDGMAVVTLSNNMPAAAPMRFGTNGMYLSSRSDDPIEMLSAHLEQTVGMAEKRDSTVVTFDESESIDVCLLGRRVLAEVKGQYGEQLVDVESASYGRFSFPPTPVAELAAV